MRKLKRLLACLLAAITLISMSACSDRGNAENTTGTPTQATTATTTGAPAQTTEAPTTEATTVATQPQATETTGESEEDIIGKTVEYVYTNEFLGIGVQIDPAWLVATPEEMAQLVGVTADVISDEDMAEMLRNSGVVYDMYTMSSDGMQTVSVALENLGLIYGTILSEEAYIELSKDQLVAALESAGLTDVTAEVAAVNLAGADHAGVKIHGAVSGVDFYETLVCLKKGSYMAIVVAGTYYENTTEALIAQFYALEG